MLSLRSGSLALGLVLFAVSGCGNRDVTRTGAVVIDWDPSKSTRPSFPNAKIGERIKHAVHVGIAPPAKGGPTDLLLSFETAPVDLEEDDKTVHHTSVVSLKLTVDKNPDWTLTGQCDGPNYDSAATHDGKAETLEAMILICRVSLQNGPNFNYGASLWMAGDGTIENESVPDVKVTIAP